MFVGVFVGVLVGVFVGVEVEVGVFVGVSVGVFVRCSSACSCWSGIRRRARRGVRAVVLVDVFVGVSGRGVRWCAWWRVRRGVGRGEGRVGVVVGSESARIRRGVRGQACSWACSGVLCWSGSSACSSEC